MALYRIINKKAVRWTGERINKVSYPKNIEALWSAADLAAIGLYAPALPDPVPAGQQSTGVTVQIVGGVPKEVYTLTPIVITPDDVRAEAQRRILAIAPQHVQANMTARGVELLYKGVANLTPAEQAEAQAAFTLFDAIKKLRAASNVLEQATPIPLDYEQDNYWI